MFWRRYFYKVHQLELDECRRRNLKQMKKERLLRLKQAKERNDSWNSGKVLFILFYEKNAVVFYFILYYTVVVFL